MMAFKFERLEIWSLSLDYIDRVYDLLHTLPAEERFNLVAQMRRAVTSVALNIAEGSTGQTDAEQARFLGMALRSVVETVAGLYVMRRRGYVTADRLVDVYHDAETLTAKIQAMRKSIQPEKPWVREEEWHYASEQSSFVNRPSSSADHRQTDQQSS